MPKSPHEGHRERLRSRILREGLDSMEPHVVLEALLFYAYPRIDTNVLAHDLLNRFGSLSGVLDAPYDLLKEVPGMGEKGAFFLKLFPQVFRMYSVEKAQEERKPELLSFDQVYRQLRPKYIGRDTEVVCLMLLDSQSRLIFCGVISEGDASACAVYVKKVVSIALQYNASFAILSHNHPSGSLLPSSGDLSVTRKVFRALSEIDVTLLDHIILTEKDGFSFANNQIMPELFEPY